jgi:hypothetical protein
MEKTIEILLKEHGERIANEILIMSNDEVAYMTDTWDCFRAVRNKAVDIARRTK